MKIFFFLLLILSSIEVHAKPKWRLTNMEVGGVRFKPSDTSWETGAFIDFAWTPMYDFDGFALHGSFQATSGRDRSTNRFLITGYQGFALLHLYTIVALDVGGGLQTWHSIDGGTFPIISANLCLRVGEDTFDRIYVGVGHFFHTLTPSLIVRAGSSFSL